MRESEESSEEKQRLFDGYVDSQDFLTKIEHELRKKRFLMIDSKSAKNIRNKQVSFKIFEEGNSVEEYTEPDKPYFVEDVTSAEIYEDMMSPNYNFVGNPDT